MSIEAMKTAPFAIGITTVPGPAQSMDMSLDDLIQARRNASTESSKPSKPSTSTPRSSRRKSLKSTTGSATKGNDKKDKAAKNIQKALGSSRAKRNAKAAAKRGISNNSKPDPKSIEREIYRLQRTGGNGNGNLGVGSRTRSSGQPRRSNRIRNSTNNNSKKKNDNSNNNSRSAVDRKIKAKNLGRRNKNSANNNSNNSKNSNNNRNSNNNSIQNVLKPPSQKAFNAAVKAMNTAGFKAPKGMKMVISFAPTENKTNNKRGQNARGRRS